jgi:tRNA(His) 5'-end guanylyltransferase
MISICICLIHLLFFQGTFSKDKNELLAQRFQMNCDDEPAMFRKGSSVYREKVMLQNIQTCKAASSLLIFC